MCVAVRQSNLALVLQALGDYPEAARLLRLALEADLKNFGPEHPSVAGSHNNLAWLLLDMEQPETALGHFEKAVAIFKKVLGEQHPYTRGSQKGLAESRRRLGRE